MLLQLILPKALCSKIRLYAVMVITLIVTKEILPPRKKIINTTIIHVPSKYGAIAVNPKVGASAVSINMDSSKEAEREAIKNCESGGKYAPCKASGWVRNGCISAVSGQKSSRYILFKATGKPGYSEQIAMSRCNKSGASNCQVIIPEACSVPEGMYD